VQGLAAFAVLRGGEGSAAVIRDPDRLRTVWLFGRPYWWDRADGRLTLKPATWIKEQPGA
jgi:hypothetical protein